MRNATRTSAGSKPAANALERARRSFAERAWERAFTEFSALARGADEPCVLGLEDIERTAIAAALTGRDGEFLDALERLHTAALAAGESARAARAALWSVMRLTALGETGRASGWVSRLRRLAEQAGPDSLEHSFLQIPLAFVALNRGELVEAERIAHAGILLSDRFGDADTLAFSRSLAGRAVLRQGRTHDGLALLDECMLSVTAGSVSPIISALVYCTVIGSLHEVYAFDRARQWTHALAEWCDAQPELVAFRGVCMVHRAEIARLGGDWARATEQAERASAGVPGHQNPESVGDAHYELAELHRLRGELEAAERAYTEAARHGHEPHPGIALLRVKQGRTDAALSGLKRALAEVTRPLARVRLLPAAVEVLLEAGATDEALLACHELETIANAHRTEALAALAAHARATVHLHAEDARAALGPLRRAFYVWQTIGAPYAAAKVRVDLARACEALGDGEGAALERAAARATFRELGAALDLASLTLDDPKPAPKHGLTERELQVLRLVATGDTNKAIAGALGLSEKTVDRHVSNVFGKLGVASRAATAYAYEHGLIAS